MSSPEAVAKDRLVPEEGILYASLPVAFSTSIALGSDAVLGQILTAAVTYFCGNFRNGNDFEIQFAGNKDFEAGCFALVGSEVLSADFSRLWIARLRTGWEMPIAFAAFRNCRRRSSTSAYLGWWIFTTPRVG